MRQNFTFWLCFFLFLGKVYSQSILTIGSTTVIADTIVTGINVPWEIIWGPDNQIWMTERKGMVSRIDPVLKTKTPILDLTNSNIYYYGEAGMLGMALHPDFATVKEVFLVYTYTTTNNTKLEKLVKYNWTGSALVNEQILIDSIIANVNHDGSRLLFMADKTLLMTIGEADNSSLAQNLNSLNGKVLRLNPDGSVPADNPFPGSYVYTYGHRNPQGLTMGPNGNFYISEHGPSTDDEFQVLEKGRNYGWPNVEGFCDLPAEITYCSANNIKEPIVNWSPTIAPADLTYYHNPHLPEFNDCFLMTVLKDKKVVAIKLDAANTSYVSQASYFSNMFGRLRDVCIGSQQEIYLATNGANSFNTDPDTHSLIVLRPATTVGLTRANDPSIQVYPTFTNESITIKTGRASAEEFSLTLTDVCGKICKAEKFSAVNYSCNLDGIGKGIYFLKLQGPDKSLNQYKIVVVN